MNNPNRPDRYWIEYENADLSRSEEYFLFRNEAVQFFYQLPFMVRYFAWTNFDPEKASDD